ncbi:MAG: chorismate mutase, partial [Oscillospiraceae bacterium]|nr:chorismate mutase [Oscillospiraceae bacterium]
MDKLELSRQEIDRIDREIAALFCRRMEAVRDIASYKRSHGLPILDSQREA